MTFADVECVGKRKQARKEMFSNRALAPNGLITRIKWHYSQGEDRLSGQSIDGDALRTPAAELVWLQRPSSGRSVL